jgi:predicted glutamine amidotransferase
MWRGFQAWHLLRNINVSCRAIDLQERVGRMCRHYGFRANEQTKVECTLVHAQNALLTRSRSDLRGKTHTDGWGIAFYDQERPEVERRATAAFDDVHFNAIAVRLYAKTVVAHVRKSTIGGPSLANTHPFVYESWSISHNGTESGFHQQKNAPVPMPSDAGPIEQTINREG